MGKELILAYSMFGLCYPVDLFFRIVTERADSGLFHVRPVGSFFSYCGEKS